MGCASSRFDKRNKCSGDLNTVGLAFVGGEAHEFDNFPIDRVGWAMDKTKEIADTLPCEADMTAGDETITTEIYKKAFTALSAKCAELDKKYGSAADGKTQYVDNKYDSKDALGDLKRCVDFLKEKSGITVEAAGGEKKEEATDEKKEEGGEGDKKDDEAGENEGGEEADGAAEGEKAPEEMAKENPHKYDGDSYVYDGWAKVPAAFLKQFIVSPYVGDLVKADAINFEFNPEKAKVTDFTAIAGLVGHAVNKSAADGQNVWLSGYVGEEDMLALKDISEGENASKKIHFPFLTYGWASKDEALQALALLTPQKGTYHKVLFEVTGAKALKFVDCRLVCHRLNGTIDAAAEFDETDKINHFKVAAVAIEEKTIEQWKKDVEAAAAAAAEAAKAKKEEGEKKDDAGEGEKKDDAGEKKDDEGGEGEKEAAE